MASHNSSDPHTFTPPHDHHSPTKHDVLAPLTNGSSIAPTEIPKRESIPSASEVPSQQISPPSGRTPFSAAGSPPVTNPVAYPWFSGANGTAQAITSPSEPERNYRDLYELKQQQLEQAETAHKDMMEEVLRARTRAEELTSKVLDELRLEVKSVRKVEEGLREKLEDQLRREREAWSVEREMLMQKMGNLEDHAPYLVKLQHREQENQALRMRIEQLKHRLRICDVSNSLSGELSPGPEDNIDFLSPTGRTPMPSTRRVSSPNGRNGRHSSADRYAFFTSRRPTPNTLKLQEAPFEPPGTAIPPLSPPPASYRRHAGHTPGASVALRSPPDLENNENGGTETPRQPSYGSLAGVAAQGGKPVADTAREQTLHRANQELLDNPEDPPLKGALGLRNDPEESTLFLDMLNKKLSDVSDDPVANKPKVLKRDVDELSVISESVDGQSTIDAAEAAGTTAPEDETEVKKKRDDEETIPLRLKPSMNFGAPLGHVRSG